jgi:hypothetical protein
VKNLFLAFLFLSPLFAGTQIRVATYNTSLALDRERDLLTSLRTGTFPQAKRVAEVLQLIEPDILVLNEFDYDAGSTALNRFHDKFLNVSQNGRPAQNFPYRYTAPSNTGTPSGFDLDNNGTIDISPGDQTYGNDSFGFGEFEGKYGMAVLSKYPIDTEAIRTFQLLKWNEMPNNVIPSGYYAADELAAIRLSSKSHWDIPIQVGEQRLHFLVSHPTPPVFDGPEDKNGRRNHDEIRLWSDYISQESHSYLIDDLGSAGGLAGERFIIAGDQNADPNAGDSFNDAINQLLLHPKVDSSITPERSGSSTISNRFHTATFNLRADYVLPSKAGFNNLGGAVFWPTGGSPGANRLSASDHRPVYMDLELALLPKDPIQNLSLSLEEGIVTLTWIGAEAASYQIENSTDLLTWDSFNVTTSFENGQWSSSFPSSQTQRFLRITHP